MDLDAIVQRFEGDASGFQDAIQKVKAGFAEYSAAAAAANQRAAAAVGQSSAQIATLARTSVEARTGLSALSSGLAGLATGALTGLVASLSVDKVIEFAASFQQIENALKVAGVAEDDLSASTEKLFNIARQTSQPVENMADLFRQLSIQTKDLGLSQEQLYGFLTTVGKALAASGTSAGAARGALTQLGQALGSAVVRSEEFNSLQEGAPILLQAAARGIDAAGGSIARLRQLVIAGKLSNKEFYDGIVAGSAVVDDAFAKMTPTIRQAGVNLSTALTEFIGRTDEAAGGTRVLAQAINELADAISSTQFQSVIEDQVTGLEEVLSHLSTTIAALLGLLRELGRVAEDILPDSVIQRLTNFKSLFSFESTVTDLDNLAGGATRLNNAIDALQSGRGADAALESLFGNLGTIDQQLDATNAGIAELKQRLAGGGGEVPLTDRLFGTGRERDQLLAQLAELEAQAERLQGIQFKETFKGLEVPPESAARLGRTSAEIEKPPTPAGALPDEPSKLDQTIARLKEQAQLLRDTLLTHQQISAILTQEAALKGQLGPGDRARLTSAVAELEAAQKQRAVFDQIAQLKDQNVALQMPTQELRDAADAAAKLGVSLADVHTPDDLIRVLQAMPRALREATAETARLKQEARTLQFGTQVQQLRNQNIAAAAGPGPTRIAAQALAQQGINLAPPRTPPITQQADAIRAIHAQMDGLDEATKRVTEDFIAQTEAAQQISLNEDLANQLAQVRLGLRYTGQESEEYRVQARLLQIKLSASGAITDAQEAQVRQIEAGTTAIREQNFLLQQQQQRVDTQAKIRAAGNPADILSQQFLGTQSEQTRIEATTRETMRANPDMDPDVARQQAAQQEALNTQLAITDELLPSIADSMAQIAQTSMTEGPEAAARQFLQTLSEMAIRLGILIALQATFNALSGTGGAGAAAGSATGAASGGQGTGPTAMGLIGHVQIGGPVQRGKRFAVAEDSKAELFLPDSLKAQPVAASLSPGAIAAATGIREPDVRSLSRSRGGQALMGLLAASGEQPTGARRGGVQLLGARGPQLFVPPEDGTVLNNQDLRRIEGSPSGRAMLRRLGRAAGGPVSRGQPYITGERQEELFLPDGITFPAFAPRELAAPALPAVPAPGVAGSVVALPMARTLPLRDAVLFGGQGPFRDSLPIAIRQRTFELHQPASIDGMHAQATELAAIVQAIAPGSAPAAIAGMAAEAAPTAAPAALAPGGPLRAGQQAIVGERGPELMLRGRLAEAARAGRLEQAVARLDQVPRQDLPIVLGARGQERVISDRSAEVLSTDNFRRLTATRAGQRMLTQLGAAPPPALAVTQPKPGTDQVRRLAAGTINTAQMLSGGASQRPQQIVVNNAPPEFRVIDQRPAGSPPIEQSSQTGADGRLVITAMVRSATAEMLRTGEHQSVMRNVYGIVPRPRA